MSVQRNHEGHEADEGHKIQERSARVPSLRALRALRSTVVFTLSLAPTSFDHRGTESRRSERTLQDAQRVAAAAQRRHRSRRARGTQRRNRSWRPCVPRARRERLVGRLRRPMRDALASSVSRCLCGLESWPRALPRNIDSNAETDDGLRRDERPNDQGR
jgi:hypothetical protein